MKTTEHTVCLFPIVIIYSIVIIFNLCSSLRMAFLARALIIKMSYLLSTTARISNIFLFLLHFSLFLFLSHFTVSRKNTCVLFTFTERKIMWLIHMWQCVDILRQEDYDYFFFFSLHSFFETENKLILFIYKKQSQLTTTTSNLIIFLFLSPSLCFALLLFFSWYVLWFECCVPFAHCTIVITIIFIICI